MANTPGFVEHVLDLARPAGSVAARAMFGGHGVYIDGTIVAIVVDDVMYLKTDDATRSAFVDLELEPFRYRARDGTSHETSYFRAPDEALESPPAMREWLRGALAAALRSRAGKRPAKTTKRRGR
jgi:DNA transformation protein and related proteins